MCSSRTAWQSFSNTSYMPSMTVSKALVNSSVFRDGKTVYFTAVDALAICENNTIGNSCGHVGGCIGVANSSPCPIPLLMDVAPSSHRSRGIGRKMRHQAQSFLSVGRSFPKYFPKPAPHDWTNLSNLLSNHQFYSRFVQWTSTVATFTLLVNEGRPCSGKRPSMNHNANRDGRSWWC